MSFIETDEYEPLIYPSDCYEPLIYAPEGPVGHHWVDSAQFCLQAQQIGTVIDLVMTTSMMAPGARFSIREESRVRLFVDTWTMRRVDQDVDTLECVGAY